jgi:hypothetical protein
VTTVATHGYSFDLGEKSERCLRPVAERRREEESRKRPGVAQRVPGGLGLQIS